MRKIKIFFKEYFEKELINSFADTWRYLFPKTYPAVVNYNRMNFKMFTIQRYLLLE